MKPLAIGKSSPITELNERSREIFRRIVDSYVETGEPVGSRTLSRQVGLNLSAASIRNVMADLEEAGLLASPHTSAGRVPTEAGLRLFVNGLLEVGSLTAEERESIESQCVASGRSMAQVLQETTQALSGLSRCVSVVSAPKLERALRHIEFVAIGPGRALVVLVTEDGMVENRIVEVPLGLPSSALTQATNYLGARIIGRTADEARQMIATELETNKAELDQLTSQVVEAGLASWAGNDDGRSLIVRGQAHLLGDITALADLERIRTLFDLLERKEAALRLLESVSDAEGVHIFIGAMNDMFNLTGCSMVVAPYQDRQGHLVGAIGVIGPTRINYARIIPMVDYTAKLIGRMIG
jgi:heat-inducible transcriptional repressor